MPVPFKLLSGLGCGLAWLTLLLLMAALQIMDAVVDVKLDDIEGIPDFLSALHVEVCTLCQPAVDFLRRWHSARVCRTGFLSLSRALARLFAASHNIAICTLYPCS